MSEFTAENGESWVYTGPEQGMTQSQAESFAAYFARKQPGEFRHGDCVGGDATAHSIVTGLSTIPVFKHPQNGSSYHAWCYGGTELPAKLALERNRDMVNVAKQHGNPRLVATPPVETEGMLSRVLDPRFSRALGGWGATIRYALKVGVPVTVIWRDGRVDEDWSVK